MRSLIGRGVALAAVAMAMTTGGALVWGRQEPGVVERLDEAGREAGRKLDEAGRKIRRGFEKGFNNARGVVDEQFSRTRDRVHDMNVASRIYGRLHWDKMLVDANFDLTVEARGVVTLRGTVADDQARERAVQLTVDTVGVSRVIDQLAVESAAEPAAAAPGEVKAKAKASVEIRTPAPASVEPDDEAERGA